MAVGGFWRRLDRRPSERVGYADVRRQGCLQRRVVNGLERSAARATEYSFQGCPKEDVMQMLTSAGPLVSLIAGILILVVPRLLNYIVAIYLIVIGLLGLFGSHIR